MSLLEDVAARLLPDDKLTLRVHQEDGTTSTFTIDLRFDDLNPDELAFVTGHLGDPRAVTAACLYVKIRRHEPAVTVDAVAALVESLFDGDPAAIEIPEG
jgi:hypothetical protein